MVSHKRAAPDRLSIDGLTVRCGMAVLLLAYSCTSALGASVGVHAETTPATPHGIDHRPRYPAPVQFRGMADTLADVPIQLIGIDLAQGGREITGDTPQLDGTLPLTLSAYWLPMIRMEASLPVRITIWDGMGLITHQQSFKAGPVAGGESTWEAGSVHRIDYLIKMEDVAKQFSGRSYLSIAIQTSSQSAQPPLPLQQLKIRIAPIVKEVALPDDAVRAAFPADASAYGVYIRLGVQSAATIQVPKDWPAHVSRLGVVSSLSYRGAPQGEPVGYMIVNEGTGSARKLPILSGDMTSRCDYDLFAAGQLQSGRAPVFSSRDSAMLDSTGKPALFHTYVGVCDVSPPLKIKTISFVCDREVLLDIFGVVAMAE